MLIACVPSVQVAAAMYDQQVSAEGIEVWQRVYHHTVTNTAKTFEPYPMLDSYWFHGDDVSTQYPTNLYEAFLYVTYTKARNATNTIEKYAKTSHPRYYSASEDMVRQWVESGLSHDTINAILSVARTNEVRWKKAYPQPIPQQMPGAPR